jgi:hypothetical protein
LIAGEEPDLCRRIRGLGFRILHIDAPMTGHDLALHHVSQYWRRAIRTGHAYAEVAARYRDTPDPLWSRESRKNLIQGSIYVVAILAVIAASFLLHSWIPLLVAALVAVALIVRTAIGFRWKGLPWPTLLAFGIHSHVQHVPILFGQLLYLGRMRRGASNVLIEYKSS